MFGKPTHTETVQGRVEPPAAPALHPAQTRRIDWEQEAADESRRQLPAVRGPSYVPFTPTTVEMPRVGIASPDANLVAEITPAAVIEGKTLGSHADRARAWLKYSLPLCVGIALSMVIAAVTLYDVPLLSFTALLTFGLTFVISYGLLLARYWQHTPEGVALVHTRNLWSYFRSEQAHRHSIEREAWQDQRALSALSRKGDRHVR